MAVEYRAGTRVAHAGTDAEGSFSWGGRSHPEAAAVRKERPSYVGVLEMGR